MSDEELDRLEALCNAATPGPWFWDDGDPPSALLSLYNGPDLPGFPMDEDKFGERSLENPAVLSLDEWGTDELTANDRTFIVAARTALPALIAEVRRLRAASLPAPARDLAGYHTGPFVPYGSAYEEAAQ